MAQPGRGRTEAAPVEIERREFLVEVDMEPLASAVAALLSCQIDHCFSDARTLVCWFDDDILEPRVHSAIGDDVEEAERHCDVVNEVSDTVTPGA